MPTGWQRLYRQPWVMRQITRHFNRMYYANPERTMFATGWLGTTAVKYPLDLWVYQEIIAEQRPDLIIETGTYRGGSALYLASVCDLLDHGSVMSIDIADAQPPAHPRVEYVLGSSVAPEILTMVRERAKGKRVLVILDADHSRDHVLAELRAYTPFIPVGGHLIVEDTNVNGHPVLPTHGPGPYEAVEAFLQESDDFRIDTASEKFFCTANPNGFLQRMR